MNGISENVQNLVDLVQETTLARNWLKNEAVEHATERQLQLRHAIPKVAQVCFEIQLIRLINFLIQTQNLQFEVIFYYSIPESCDDGIRNQDEVQTDCGGKCPACPST